MTRQEWWRSSVVVLMVAGCASTQPLTQEERDETGTAVDSAIRSFQEAERARDVERIIAHLAPDFYIYVDGVRNSYAQSSEMIRQAMPTLDVFEPAWNDLEIRVLGRNAAVASFVFRDSMVTVDGDVTVTTGPTTLVWERRGDDWLVVYADADHYSVGR
jgi:ketosteroid isomerase-like protein